jgi:hypothetical protein
VAACDDFNDCTTEMCDPADADQGGDISCSTPNPVANGTPCEGGTCQAGACELTGTVLPCTEQGIRNAIAAGNDTYTFACDGTTPVVTQAEIEIDNDVILDGEGNLTVDGNCDHRMFVVPDGVTADVRHFTVTKSGFRVFVGSVVSIENQGILTLTSTNVTQNTAGIHNDGTLTLTSSRVSGNDGEGISSSGTLTLTDSTVLGNAGRGIFTAGMATVTNSTVSGNSVAFLGEGSGIFNEGTLTLTNSTVSENHGMFENSGIFNNGGTLTLTDSTVSGNDGGGIWNTWNAVWDIGTVTLTNSTVSQTAPGDWGIFLWNGGAVTLTNSTVSGGIRANTNTDPGDPPSFVSVVATATLIDGPCILEGDEVTWTTSHGYNIESPSDTCGFNQTGDQSGVTAEELNLGPLVDNGGPTKTHKPGDGGFGAGSVAIDWIPEADCTVDTDQRGEARPVVIVGPESCDVGAFEVQP